MTSGEFDAATALEKVRQARAIIDQLDMFVGQVIPDTEHATLRRTLREWETRLQSGMSIRKKRSDAQLPLEAK